MTNAVVAEGLTVVYPGVTAIAPSTFTIPKGSITAVIGPNGSGKSTLLGLIAGLVEPTAGTIDIANHMASKPAISVVLQTTKVNESLPISVAEVVTMGRYAAKGPMKRLNSLDREAVQRAMERLGITDIANRHLSHLSGGQRQRAFVAQGLAQDHDLLLLDEPLTGIDITAAQAIDDAIHEELEEGCTVIMTTHDLSEARYADYVVLLSGRVVAAGPPDEVLTREHLLEAYGPSLLHVEGENLFIDDAAHLPVDGRHVHHERTIHTESSRSDLHGPD